MKTHTTNYFNTLIEIAEDCPVSESVIPPEKKEKTIANLQYDFLIKSPYKYTSDDIIFNCNMIKNDILESEKAEEKLKFFSKGQARLRTSPLAKRYGFGIHHNDKGKVAIIPAESKEYHDLVENNSVKKVKAMRSKRK